ncbi:MAG TPA: DegT/DnrJ/EryC1/StrS family aminotransferase [Chthoniobacterales bacterium]|jgi:dTDP-4-amino-4,6-dideoxygalactose transaminase|nr:DegT/DnrJ/EryC1/StrS family aminotransferase [Chthoniobacterales bacterium]
MRVPLLDLSEQYTSLADSLRAEIDEVLAAQHFILGPKVKAFEQAVAGYCQSPYAIGVSSGTDALLAIFMAMGLGPGDAVITSDYSFFASGSCVARVGATPVFIDIDPVTYNISIDALEHYLTASCRQESDGSLRTPKGHKVQAIVPVHLFGLCCDMDRIAEVAGRHGIPVIEDAAQALGAEFMFKGRAAKAGTMGSAGTFSFYPSKNLGAAGDAGLIVCREESFATRLRHCRQHGMEPRYYHQFIGGNFRLDELQAAILNVKLPWLDKWSAARRKVADTYREEFERLNLSDRITLPSEPYRTSGLAHHHIYHQYVIRTDRRDELRDHLSKREIGTAIYYPVPLHAQECFRYLGSESEDFPEATRAAKETLALPIYPELSREAQRYVAESIAEFYA